MGGFIAFMMSGSAYIDDSMIVQAQLGSLVRPLYDTVAAGKYVSRTTFYSRWSFVW